MTSYDRRPFCLSCPQVNDRHTDCNWCASSITSSWSSPSSSPSSSSPSSWSYCGSPSGTSPGGSFVCSCRPSVLNDRSSVRKPTLDLSFCRSSSFDNSMISPLRSLPPVSGQPAMSGFMSTQSSDQQPSVLRSPLQHYEPLDRRRPSLPLSLQFEDWWRPPLNTPKITSSIRPDQCRHLWFDTPHRRHSEGELAHSRACPRHHAEKESQTRKPSFVPNQLERVGEHVIMEPPTPDHVDSHVMPILINCTSEKLVFVQFKCGRVDVFQQSPSVTCHIHDYVIVDADRGKDLGRVIRDHVTLEQAAALKARQHHEQQAVLSEAAANSGDSQQPSEKPGIITPKQVLRLALPIELEEVVNKENDEKDAVALCQSKVQEMNLSMDVLDAEFQWDRRKLTFFYYATRRIDFRELVRDLFRHYKTRIWMCAVPKGAVNSRADVETLSPVPLKRSCPKRSMAETAVK